MAIGYDGGAYSGNLDEISRALGVEPDIEGVTSRLGTPVDRLGDATILGSAGIPLEGGLTIAQSLASLALIDPQLVRDIMSDRTYMAGTGLLGQGDMEDPLLQQISLMGNEQGDTINFGQLMGETYDSFLDRTMAEDDKGASDVKKAIDNLDKSLEDILPDTPPGTTDIFNAKTGLWEAVYEKMVDRPSETSFVDEQVLDVGGDILSGTQSFEVATPLGTTDIFDTETGEWTALTKTEDEKTEEEEINSLINQLSRPKVKEGQAWRTSAEDELQKAIALEEETTVLDLEEEEEDESIFQKVIAETLGLPVDTVNAVISSILRAAGASEKVIANPVGGRAWLMENRGMTVDGLVDQIATMLSPTTSSGVVAPTPEYSWPTIPTVQDTQATVMDEGILASLNMTADESHALTRELNRQRVGGRTPYPHEIEARKQGALINPLTSRYAQTGQNLEQLEEDQNLISQIDQQTGNFLEGLSQAMRNVLNDDPELMAQYMATRSSIIAQLDKTKFQHEDWYPGSQAAATQAGFWGPKALGWNDKYNEYKDAQRELMGLQSGQMFKSDDWINNLGWMSPEQINRISGYGAP